MFEYILHCHDLNKECCMEKINKERLRYLLKEEKVEVEVASYDISKTDTYEIGFNTYLVAHNSGTKLKFKGYTVETFKGKKHVLKKYRNIFGLFSYLDKEQVFDADEVTVVSYNGQYKTYQEYVDALAFNNIDMSGILEKYLPQADRFSLNCPFCLEYDAERMQGTYRLSDEHAEYARDKARTVTLKNLGRVYERISNHDKENLPPFDKLIESITEEIKEYRHALGDKTIDSNDGDSFICDEFSMGKTRLTSPQELWHFYHGLDNLFMYYWICDKLQKNTIERPLDAIIDTEYYSPLKQDLINIEVTFCWHCTMSSELTKVFYFRLTDNSIAWLKTLKNDYDMRELQDLAFYNGDKLLFSSCTHEGFHSDCMDN